MNVKAIVALWLAMTSFPVFASNGNVLFDGAVKQTDGVKTRFELEVPAGKTAKLTLSDGTFVEFMAGQNSGHLSASMVKLFNAKGQQLHEATWPNNPPTQFSYVLCGSRAMYISPEDPSKEDCSK